jgi:hypothetical protein
MRPAAVVCAKAVRSVWPVVRFFLVDCLRTERGIIEGGEVVSSGNHLAGDVADCEFVGIRSRFESEGLMTLRVGSASSEPTIASPSRE